MKKIKIITVFLLAISIFEIALLTPNANAIEYQQGIAIQSESTLKIADELTPDDYKPSEDNGKIDVGFINKYGGRFYSVLYALAIIIAIIAIMVIGIKYIFGSVEEKAEYKKNLIPIAIGIAFIAVLLTILPIIANIAENIS